MEDWEGLVTSNTSELEKLIKEEVESTGVQRKVFTNISHEEHDKKLLTSVGNSVRDMAVKKKLIPACYKDAVFDVEKIQQNIVEQLVRTNNIYIVDKFDRYKNVCYGILSALRTGNLPDRSWIIGAPNGFGKTTFVTECLVTMEEKSMRTVPYISLIELARLKVAEEHRIMNAFSFKSVVRSDDNSAYVYTDPNSVDFIKTPIDVTDHYSWSEYINSECLFCYFTDVSSKQVESRILYQVLQIRAAKGLPTIVMISTSINPYLNDRVLKEQVWDEILGVESGVKTYDRLVHVSCYKLRRNAIMEREEGSVRNG